MNEWDESIDNILKEITESDHFLINKVEEAIYRNPGIAEVAVVFMPGTDGKSYLAAFIVPSDLNMNPQKIKYLVESSGYLSADEFPRRYHMVPKIPRTSNGILQKHKLAQYLFGDD